MKVLWFTNTPCSAEDLLGGRTPYGGWLRSLEEAISGAGGVELSICFYSTKKLDVFKHGNTTFYPVARKRPKTTVARALRRARNVMDDERELREIQIVIDKCRPDLIHVHGTEDNFGLIQERTAVPVVISLQGILTAYEEKYYAGIPEQEVTRHERKVDRLAVSGYNNTFKNFRKRAARERSILSNSRFIMGRTEWDRRLSRLLAPNARYFRCDELMRSEFYASRWSKTKFETPFKILTTCGNNLYKGLEVIVGAATALKERKVAFEWHVAGLAPRDPLPALVKSWLKADFAKLGIRLLGVKDTIELNQLLSQTDVYCQVSHIENSPNSLCEAMLAGVPVVASACGGTSSLLENGVDGLLYPPGESQSCAAALLTVQGDFNAALKMSGAAREAAHRRHEPSRVVRELMGIYEFVSRQ